MVTAAWLKNTELFSGLEEPQLSVILSHSSVESFPEGKTIFYQGEEAHRLYILIEGISHSDGQDRREDRLYDLHHR